MRKAREQRKLKWKYTFCSIFSSSPFLLLVIDSVAFTHVHKIIADIYIFIFAYKFFAYCLSCGVYPSRSHINCTEKQKILARVYTQKSLKEKKREINMNKKAVLCTHFSSL